MMNRSLATVTAGFLLLLVLLPEPTHARPPGVISRQKRVSDQRLAELETLMALSRLKGKLVTVPIGFGRVDPAKIGRKRRSSAGNNIQNLRRFFQNISQDAELIDDERRGMIPASWSQKDANDRPGNEMKDPPFF
ncbi:uncharacterized protein LOC117176796 [Belonocnema kinseyi]|uniref:uncharacterized protein LOC117176796 n=1 Tax=Belonocnema kinseyi TaxID=2817044 RepID=UPI00143DCA7F|nr:uncharacterized protein LOC117176796 [Belonocnema kinseyi]